MEIVQTQWHDRIIRILEYIECFWNGGFVKVKKSDDLYHCCRHCMSNNGILQLVKLVCSAD
jgi:hypothetical protein